MFRMRKIIVKLLIKFFGFVRSAPISVFQLHFNKFSLSNYVHGFESVIILCTCGLKLKIERFFLIIVKFYIRLVQGELTCVEIATVILVLILNLNLALILILILSVVVVVVSFGVIIRVLTGGWVFEFLLVSYWGTLDFFLRDMTYLN